MKSYYDDDASIQEYDTWQKDVTDNNIKLGLCSPNTGCVDCSIAYDREIREEIIAGGGVGIPPVDPKQATGSKKMGFDNVPISLLLHATPGANDGAKKYKPWNWLKLEDGTMSLKTYLNALQRHLLLFRAGQDFTSDTNVHNLDSMIAGLAVLRDAQLFGKVVDDRIKLSSEQIKILEELLNNE